jgi:hypothetical protein
MTAKTSTPRVDVLNVWRLARRSRDREGARLNIMAGIELGSEWKESKRPAAGATW